jgi:hypothetical protein
MKDGIYFDRAGQTYYKNGKFHREDGPAAIYRDGSQIWYQNGIIHRDDGPAIIHPDGSQDWYSNGKHLGFGAKGFWALWNCLSDDKRENAELLKFFPGLPK